MSIPLLDAKVPNYSSLNSHYNDNNSSGKSSNDESSLEEEALSDKVHETDERYRCRRASTSSFDLSSPCVPRRRLNTYPQDEDYPSWSLSKPRRQKSRRHGPQNRQDDKSSSNDDDSSPTSSNTELDGIEESWTEKLSSCRWKIAYICFLVRSVQGATRQSFNVAILGIAAEYSTPVFVSHNDSGNITYTVNYVSTWSMEFEGVALAAFSSGSLISPFLCGYLSLRIKGRIMMPICLILGGLSAVLLPNLAMLDPALIVVARVICGASMTGFDSLIQSVWSKWAPQREKASLTSGSYTGSTLGGLLAFPISSVLISINGDGKGWPFIFYFFGSCCFVLAPSWWFLVYDSPHEHPHLSEREKYILSNDVHLSKRSTKKQNLKIPWRRIFTSGPMWAVFLGYLANKWIMSFVLPFLPRFFHDLLHQSITKDSLYTTMPFVGSMVASASGAMMSDWLLCKGLSVCFTRRLFQTIGCLGCSICCILLVIFFGSSNQVISTILIILAVAFQNLTTVAYRINLLDIAPRYAGLLCGFVTTVSSAAALPGPIVCSMLISWKSPDGWQIVFSIVASINVIGGLTFLFLSQGTVQDWANTDYGCSKKISESSDNTNNNIDISKTP